MKGGCFGKILTFVFGVIIGFVLLAGTIVGGAYFLVSTVTVNKVEEVAQTKFDFIDDNAEIRDKSLLEIFNLIKAGDIKNITVEGVKKTFGIDIIDILEKTLDITLRDDGKEELKSLPVLQVFQGDNLKIVLNSVTLNDVLTKAGIDKANLGSKPLISERYDEPVIDAFNGILSELDFNKLKIGELEYLVGLSLGEGILDNFTYFTINEINDAINSVTFENILPNFSRDVYVLEGDKIYYHLESEAGYESVLFEEAYESIPDGEEIAASDRYILITEKGIVKQNDNGTYRLKPSFKDVLNFDDFYSLNDGVYEANRKGFYAVTDTAPSERYLLVDGVYERNPKGTLKAVFSDVGNGGTAYMYSYVKKFIETDVPGTFTLERRNLVKISGLDNLTTAPKYVVETTCEIVDGNNVYTNNLIAQTEETDGVFLLAKKGVTETMLQTFADMTLNSLNADIGNLTLGEVIEINDDSAEILKALKNEKIKNLGSSVDTLKLKEIIKIDESSSEILKALQDSSISTLSEDIKSLTLKEIMTINESSNKMLQALQDSTLETLSADIDNLYLTDIIDVQDEAVFLKDGEEGYSEIEDTTIYRAVGKAASQSELELKFIGSYFVYENGDNDFWALTKFIDDGRTYADATNLKMKTAKSNGAIVAMSGLQVKNLSTGMEECLNTLTLSSVIDIDGDVYEKTEYTAYADVPDNNRNIAFYLSDTGDMMNAIDEEITDKVIYFRIYEGSSNTIIKKLSAIQIQNLDTRIQLVIEQTMLSEVLTVKCYYELTESTDGAYVALPDVDYYGTFNVGKTAGSDEEIRFVDWYDALASNPDFSGNQRYDIVDGGEISSGVLIKMADKRIGTLTAADGGMQDIINDTVMSEVMDISGDVYVKLTANNYTAAVIEAGAGVTVYYQDGSGLYLSAGYVRTNDTADAFVKIGDDFVVYDDTDPLHANLQKYKGNGVNETEYYKKIYEGLSNSILRKLAPVTVGKLAQGNTINRAVDDCTMAEMGIAPASDDKSIMYKMRNYKICELQFAIEDIMGSATIRELNRWGNLGMSEASLNGLNIKTYFDYCQENSLVPDMAYDGTNEEYDMKVAYFFGHLHISVDTFGNLTITLS